MSSLVCRLGWALAGAWSSCPSDTGGGNSLGKSSLPAALPSLRTSKDLQIKGTRFPLLESKSQTKKWPIKQTSESKLRFFEQRSHGNGSDSFCSESPGKQTLIKLFRRNRRGSSNGAGRTERSASLQTSSEARAALRAGWQQHGDGDRGSALRFGTPWPGICLGSRPAAPACAVWSRGATGMGRRGRTRRAAQRPGAQGSAPSQPRPSAARRFSP